MRMLTCFLPPTAGTATVAGFDVLEQPLEVKKRIGYLPETPPLYPEMGSPSTSTFVGQLKGLSADRNCASGSTTSASAAPWPTSATSCIGKLSKGYRQRVGLAQAIIHNPDVLDSRRAHRRARSQADQRDARPDQEPRRRSHHHSEHAHPSGSRADLRAGHHHQQGQTGGHRFGEQSAEPRARRENPCWWKSPGATARSIPRPCSAARAGRRREPRHRSRTSGTANVSVSKSRRPKDRVVRGDLARAVVEAGWDLNELRPSAMSLEEVFLQLTGAGSCGGAGSRGGRRSKS